MKESKKRLIKSLCVVAAIIILASAFVLVIGIERSRTTELCAKRCDKMGIGFVPSVDSDLRCRCLPPMLKAVRPTG